MAKRPKKSPVSDQFLNVVLFLCLASVTALLLHSKLTKKRSATSVTMAEHTQVDSVKQMDIAARPIDPAKTETLKAPAEPNFGTMIKAQAAAAARTLRAELNGQAPLRHEN